MSNKSCNDEYQQNGAVHRSQTPAVCATFYAAPAVCAAFCDAPAVLG